MQKTYRPDSRLIAVAAFISLAGCAGVIVSGELMPIMLLPIVAIPIGYYRAFKRYGPASRFVVGALSVVELLVLSADSLFISGDFFLSIAHMTIAFQAIKSFDLRQPWDYLQVYFMSIMQLVIASELTHTPTAGAIFTISIVLFVIAMIMAHFESEGLLRALRLQRPVVVITAAVFVFTIVFFIASPRVGAGLIWRKSGRAVKTVGFSDKVDFGSFGDILQDTSVVMRAEISQPLQSVYFRGGTLDYFDGHAWESTLQRRLTVFKENGMFVIEPYVFRSAARDLIVQRIYAEPLDTDIVFGLGHVIALESQGRYLETNAEGVSFLPAKKMRRLFYTAYSIKDEEGLLVSNKERYLQVPAERWAERIAALARSVTADKKNINQKALAIEKYLKNNYKYSLSIRQPPAGITAIEDFLFNTKTGFCEHFSTAMVLMLRSIGVPARIVTGFYVGAESPQDYVIVRQSNAHSWVEAVIDGRWMRFDPTPISVQKPSAIAIYLDNLRLRWYRYVVGFSTKDQLSILGHISYPFKARPSFGTSVRMTRFFYIVPLIAALLVILYLAIEWIKRRGRSFETSLYIKFREGVKKAGGLIGPHLTPKEVLAEALRLGYGEKAKEFIRLYEEIRFGGRKLTASERRYFQRLSSFQPNSPTRGTNTHGV